MSEAQRTKFDIIERFKHKRVFTSRGMIQFKGIVEQRKQEIARKKEMKFYHNRAVKERREAADVQRM